MTQWRNAAPLAKLRDVGKLLVRIDGKQFALFDTPQGVKACDNRCPHEGYPLTEGSLTEDCVLTCNWHNWKFDLCTGENVYGGDRLRVYPLEVRGDDVWIDLAEPPYEDRHATIVASLHDAFNDHAYDRLAREIARLIKLGADPLDCLRLAVDWSWDRMEFGWTHGYAGMADWLTLYQEREQAELRLVCLVESVAHAAFDVLRAPRFPFSDAITAFDEQTFLRAIENEDHAGAIAAIRGGLRDGLRFLDFEPALTRAALAHYNDFGHSLIYVSKAGSLIDRLGDPVAEPLLLSLVRGLLYATREDRIPEFRRYADALREWSEGEDGTVSAEHWRYRGINAALDLAVSVSGNEPLDIYRALLEANAVNFLNFDIAQEDKVQVSVSGNVGWLDFTHGITFANAVRKQCMRFPELWPQGLLQMACFSGRNAAFTTQNDMFDNWHVTDIDAWIDELVERLFDHGLGEYIVSVHWLKTTLAVREELAEAVPQHLREVLAAALNRFVNSPLKRRRARRTAYQSLQFVGKG
ncbi:MAG: Rieske (2Fe-2S) protein [Gammaproteobacteria bacterium]|nr:Rieske (2Fe-2S) protein [Gammaproteobacteria bacterium]